MARGQQCIVPCMAPCPWTGLPRAMRSCCCGGTVGRMLAKIVQYGKRVCDPGPG